jgi:hypothetical protein
VHDGRPGVDHRPLADARADVDEAWHQDDVFGDMRAVADDAAGDRAEARFAKSVLAPVGEFGGHFVPPAAATRTRHDAVVVEAKRQEHSFLEPLVDLPRVTDGFCDARAAIVQHVERFVHRIADVAGGRGAYGIARIPCGVDCGLKAHANSPVISCSQSLRSVIS